MSKLGHLGKIDRAKEHLQVLEQEIAAFLRPDAYEIVCEFDDQQHIGGWNRALVRQRVVFQKGIPLMRWGTVVGDVIHNLRGALDNAVYGISFSRDPIEFRDDKTTEFPICATPKLYNAARGSQRPPHHGIRGLCPDAKAIIEGLQPYHRGNLKDDWLWILRELSNIDKHRRIHVTVRYARSNALEVVRTEPDVIVHSITARPPGILENNAVITELDMSVRAVPNFSTYMHMNREFTFAIAFGEHTPLAGQIANVALYDLLVYVEGIAQALTDFIV